MPLRRPSDFFGDSKNSLNSIQEEVSSAGSENALKIQGQFKQFKEDYKGVNNFVDTFETFKENVEKIDGLYEAVDLLKEDISSFASKEEVDSAIMSQLLFVEKSVDELKRNVKATNSKTIFEIKNNFQDLENSVNQFLSIDAPQHKKSLKESEIQVDKKLNKFKIEIDENFEFIQDQVSDKLTELSESLRGINQKNLSRVYERIEEVSGDLNNLLKKEFPKFNKVFVQSELKIEQKVNDIDSKINKVDDKIDTIESVYENRIESLRQAIDTFVEEEIPKYKKIIVESKLNSESEIKKLEDTLKEQIEGFSGRFNLLTENNNSVLDDIKAESLVSREKIDSVSKTYENLYKDFKNREIYENKKLESFSEEIDSLKKTLSDDLESLSKDSKSDVENLHQTIETKILTLRQSLEENILSSEKSIREQDTNIEIIKVSLKNISNKIKEDIISETSSKLDKKISYLEKALNDLKETTFLKEEASLLTEQPSTTTKDPLTPLDKNFVTFEDLANHYRTFINRVQVQMASIGGGGETRLQYLDDIVGIATNASAHDGHFLKYDHSQGKFVFESIAAIGAGATVTNVLYVTTDGSNANTGKKLGDAKATIAGAVSIATTGTVIKVSAGTYIENNPITLPEQVSIVGDSLREVTITPQNTGDVFYVRNGDYIANISFVGSATTGAIISFSPSGAGDINQSPYVQNCTNFIQNSTGVRINGDHASGNTKSIVVDSYTQYNQGGIGVSITNQGYGQLVSLFTICNDVAIYCGSGGACDLTNSNSSFGNFGLVADGVSPQQYVGIITTAASANSSTFVVAGVGANRPFDGQVVYIDALYYEVNKITITNGGSGYTSAPTLTIDAPPTSWGITAQAVASITNGVVTSIDIISIGRGYTTTPNITITGGDGAGLALSLEIKPKYYAIESATLPSAGISTITITENLPYAVGVGSTVPFFKQSRILASGHSFEYIGSGVTIATALPSTGGVAIQSNEVDMRNGGLVVYTSTDQSGNFRIGDGVTINQTTGDISGTAYTKSLYANVTPLILALGG